MNRKDCLDMAMEFHPDTVEDLISDAQNIFSWLNDELVIDAGTCSPDPELDQLLADALKSKTVQPKQKNVSSHNDNIPHYDTETITTKTTKSNDDEPIRSPQAIYNLIKLFIEEGSEPRPRDLIEAGACQNGIYHALKQLEDQNKIERIRLAPRNTIIRLKEVA